MNLATIRSLHDSFISIKELTKTCFRLTIQGHPDECLRYAHLLCNAHFDRPWHFTSIEAQSPQQRGKKKDYHWLFTIEGKAK